MPFFNISIYNIRKGAVIFGRVHGLGDPAPDVCIRKILNFGHCHTDGSSAQFIPVEVLSMISTCTS